MCHSTQLCPKDHFCLAPSLIPGIRLLRIARSPAFHTLRQRADIIGSRKLTAVVRDKHMPDDVTINNHHPANMSKVIVKRNIRESINGEIDNVAAVGRDVNSVAEEDEENHHHERDVSDSFHDVLYLGSPALLFQTVSFSDYTPRSERLPRNLPVTILKILDYFIKLSGALALLNMVPCIYLDGQHITESLIEWALGSRLMLSTRRTLQTSIIFSGTALLFANIAIGISSLL